jgi:hypothetical protein
MPVDVAAAHVEPWLGRRVVRVFSGVKWVNPLK